MVLLLAFTILVLCARSRNKDTDIVISPPLSPVLIVGIDGATFDLIDSLISHGQLTTLSRLMETGVSCPLKTLKPTLSPAIWTSIATGKLPKDHGILGFDGVPGHTMHMLPTSQMRKVRAFWNILSEYGRSVGVIGWWATWPAEHVNGYIVSDRATYTRMEATIGKEENIPFEVYPETLASEIAEHIYAPMDVGPSEFQSIMSVSDHEAEMLSKITHYKHGRFIPEFRYTYQSDRSISAISEHLMQTHETDVTAIAFYGVDVMSHLTWHFMEPEQFPRFAIPDKNIRRFGGTIPSYYAFVDSLLGSLLSHAPANATVMVLSDHGFGPTGNLPWSGGHGKITPGAPIAPDGILIISGQAIRKGDTIKPAHVTDILPTLLYLQGFPIAKDLKGRVLRDAFRPDVFEDHPIRWIDSYEVTPRSDVWDSLLVDDTIDQHTIEKLKSLGYL